MITPYIVYDHYKLVEMTDEQYESVGIFPFLINA